MKKLSVKSGVECQACLACVQACSKAYYKEFHQDKACLTIDLVGGVVTPTICTQCGKCAEACPEQAITQNKSGVYMINKKKCQGCGKCAEACPNHVIVLVEGAANASKCVACGLCAKACPMELLEVVDA